LFSYSRFQSRTRSKGDTDSLFQVSRDGQRFLIALPVEGAAAASPLTVDTDWRAGISK
jgi:hypothetical protein